LFDAVYQKMADKKQTRGANYSYIKLMTGQKLYVGKSAMLPLRHIIADGRSYMPYA